jgi:hypothetical protein
MDMLINLFVGVAIGGGLLLTSNTVAQGVIGFCEDEWAVMLDHRAVTRLRSFLMLAGFLFIVLGLISPLRG